MENALNSLNENTIIGNDVDTSMHAYEQNEHNGVSKLNSIILSKEAKQIETFEDFPGIIVGEVFRVQICA